MPLTAEDVSASAKKGSAGLTVPGDKPKHHVCRLCVVSFKSEKCYKRSELGIMSASRLITGW